MWKKQTKTTYIQGHCSEGHGMSHERFAIDQTISLAETQVDFHSKCRFVIMTELKERKKDSMYKRTK